MVTIRKISNLDAFQNLLSSQPNNKLVVVDFFATWCGPCKIISPIFEHLSTENTHIVFAKVDVDESQDIAKKYNVTAMPTFLFFKNGNKIAEMKGADPRKLTSLINEHGGSRNSTNPDGSSSSSSGLSNVQEYINTPQCECLNQQEEHIFRNVFENNQTYLESDVDEQLMIIIPFHQVVRLHSLSIRAPKSHAPKTLRFYVNRYSLGFDEADDIEPTQEIILSENDYKVVEQKGKKKEGEEEEREEGESTDNTKVIATIPLRYVKFQSVNAVVIFIVDNMGEEETTIVERLELFGTAVQATNVNDLKKEEQ